MQQQLRLILRQIQQNALRSCSIFAAEEFAEGEAVAYGDAEEAAADARGAYTPQCMQKRVIQQQLPLLLS